MLESRWRRNRLLILCYHGISLRDEHEWHPKLYVAPELLERRLQLLQESGYQVLGLGEGIRRLYSGGLPERSVAVTFDDGAYDFYRQAYPVLARYRIPATVYLTSYYCAHNKPVFGQICSYMLWKRRAAPASFEGVVNGGGPMELRSPEGRRAAWKKLVDHAERCGLSTEQKDELAATLAHRLEIDYEDVVKARIVQLMNAGEIAELSAVEIDFQLHTHRHRTPHTRELFDREILENRQIIERITGKTPYHFCYPSGVVDPLFLPWLRKLQIASATTCEPGIASPDMDPLLLPRFQDSSEVSDVEFVSWLTGFAPLARSALAR